jgi:uncharacterized protein YndB with AHSA1/START domain
MATVRLRLLEDVMAFPDRIERTVEVAHPPATVWAALTTAEGLAAWFGDEATIDLRPGGSARMTWTSGHTADMRVERVEEPSVFGFTWQIFGLPEDAHRKAYEGNTEGWARELDELAAYLDAS